jgi:hypothetical protein
MPRSRVAAHETQAVGRTNCPSWIDTVAPSELLISRADREGRLFAAPGEVDRGFDRSSQGW